jgi:hypothetical protein
LEGKKPLGRPGPRWEDNIKIHFQEFGGGGVDWIEFVQDRDRWWALVSTVMYVRVLRMCVEFLDWLQSPVSLSRRTVLCGMSE